MKTALLLSLLILVSQSSMAQAADRLTQARDSVHAGSSYRVNSLRPAYNHPGNSLTDPYLRPTQKRWISRGNITFATYSLQLAPIESEILDRENLERDALLNRDTSALKDIWLRDFTLKEPANQLVTDGNPIPRYISLIRMVEHINHIENVVYTSGFELFQELTSSGQVRGTVRRNFFHTWTRKHTAWKLSTKSHH